MVLASMPGRRHRCPHITFAGIEWPVDLPSAGIANTTVDRDLYRVSASRSDVCDKLSASLTRCSRGSLQEDTGDSNLLEPRLAAASLGAV